MLEFGGIVLNPISEVRMPETLVDKHTGNELLRQYLATHKVPVAMTGSDLYLHSEKDDNGKEVDDFLRLLEEWRSEGDADHRRID